MVGFRDVNFFENAHLVYTSPRPPRTAKKSSAQLLRARVSPERFSCAAYFRNPFFDRWRTKKKHVHINSTAQAHTRIQIQKNITQRCSFTHRMMCVGSECESEGTRDCIVSAAVILTPNYAHFIRTKGKQRRCCKNRRRCAKESVLNFTPRRFFNLYSKTRGRCMRVHAHIPLCREFNTGRVISIKASE